MQKQLSSTNVTYFEKFKQSILDGKLVPLELYLDENILNYREEMNMTDANTTPTTAVSSDPIAFDKYDISLEQWRTYHYSNGSTYTIKNPATLFTKNVKGFIDSHRVVDTGGVTHCPTKGWVNISWYAPTEPVSF